MSSMGKNLKVNLFGESHGPYIGVVLEGLAPGLEVDRAFIESQLDKRRPVKGLSTTRVEKDEFEIISGLFNGRTTGTPLCILIPNKDQRSSDYETLSAVARPGHADYTANLRYNGFQDYRGAGHFSGRLTCALVAAASIAAQALKEKGIEIASHIFSCAGITDDSFSNDESTLKEQMKKVSSKVFAVINKEKEEQMKEAISKAAQDCDSVGGMLETCVTGLPAGVGEPWFDSIESLLSRALFGIPAIKGVQFGLGFGYADKMGSEVSDELVIKDTRIQTEKNNNGGINGGISNGMPIVFSCVVKPTSSIGKTQKTVNFKTNEETEIQVQGRHDPAIVHRARVVVDSVTALVLYDVLVSQYGLDFFSRKEK